VTSKSEGDSLDESGALAAELKALRKGRGLSSAAFDARLGPQLRELAAGNAEQAAAGLDPGRLRQALAAALTVLAARLPDEPCIAIHASLGLAPATKNQPLFRDRVSWLAAQLKRDPRTALRRIDDAERLLAEQIAVELRRRRGHYANAMADGWYTAELSTVLLLDSGEPEAIERRRIVVTAGDVTEVSLALDVPPRNPDDSRVELTIDVLSGGTLVTTEVPSASRTMFGVRLPAPLRPGESHEFEISVRVHSRARMRPYYVLTPERRCDLFDLRVRFDRRRPPAWVRRVDGEPVRVYEVVKPGGVAVPVNAAGEAHLTFRSLSLNVGYGIQWSPGNHDDQPAAQV
jgi:hypothetical protein